MPLPVTWSTLIYAVIYKDHEKNSDVKTLPLFTADYRKIFTSQAIMYIFPTA